MRKEEDEQFLEFHYTLKLKIFLLRLCELSKQIKQNIKYEEEKNKLKIFLIYQIYFPLRKITFDANTLSYETLLHLFFIMHDPTTLNYQEPDEGTRYRSIILYENESQKLTAEKVKEESQKNYEKKIVTEIVPLTKFWNAEDYHQNYFNLNSNKNPYCSSVVKKKVDKFLKKLKEKEGK